MPARHSPDWSRLDVLMRELGALRASTQRREDVDAEVRFAIDRHIHDAAEAVDALVDAPEDDERAIVAWERILTGQDLVGRLQETAARSHDLAKTSITLRRRAAAALMASDLLLRETGRRG